MKTYGCSSRFHGILRTVAVTNRTDQSTGEKGSGKLHHLCRFHSINCTLLPACVDFVSNGCVSTTTVAWRLMFLMLTFSVLILFTLVMVCMSILRVTFLMILLLFIAVVVNLVVADAVAVVLAVVVRVGVFVVPRFVTRF